MSLPNFDIYQGTGATNCFKSHTNSLCPYFFKILSDITSLLPDNLSGLKKDLYSGLGQSHQFSRNEQMQMVFNTEQFLEVAIERYIYIYMYIY